MGVASDSGRQARYLTTGVPALDDVLGGGIPAGSTVFVTGLPGVGKTILCEQALYANARDGQNVMYLTTLSEPSVKMLKYTQEFDFFQADLLESAVHYADLGSALNTSGAEGALRELRRLIELHRPGMIVLDSFKVFREHFEDTKSFRAFVSELVILLATWEVTALLVGEYRFEQISSEPEFAIADGIFHLGGTENLRRQKRFLNIVKMRGTDAFLGSHSYEISDAGMTLYPRIVPHVRAGYPLSTKRMGSAVAGLSEMMAGGIPNGSGAIVSGGTGSGKTLTALGFAIDAARNGVPALFVSFEEGPLQILRNADEMGWDMSGLSERSLIHVLHVSPSELDIDRHSLMIRDLAAEVNAELVVVDSISAFEFGVSEASALGEYLWGLSDHFKRNGITHIFTSEAYSFFESLSSDNDRRVSYMADTIILLRLVEEGNNVRRKISVLKMRGSEHESALRDLMISHEGVQIVDGA